MKYQWSLESLIKHISHKHKATDKEDKGIRRFGGISAVLSCVRLVCGRYGTPYLPEGTSVMVKPCGWSFNLCFGSRKLQKWELLAS
jgi:hypothetical protein